MYDDYLLGALALDLNREMVREHLAASPNNTLPIEINHGGYLPKIENNTLYMPADGILTLPETHPLLHGEHNTATSPRGNAVDIYTPYDEEVGFFYGMDEYEYALEMYNGYISMARQEMEKVNKKATDGYVQTDRFGSDINNGEKAKVYYELAIKQLKMNEPGLSDEMYEKRVQAELGIETAMSPIIDNSLSQIKTVIVERLNRNVNNAASTLRGCEDSDDIRSTTENLKQRLVAIKSDIDLMSDFIDIPYNVEFEGDLHQALRERYFELHAETQETYGFSVGRLLFGHNTELCDPVLAPPVEKTPPPQAPGIILN